MKIKRFIAFLLVLAFGFILMSCSVPEPEQPEPLQYKVSLVAEDGTTDYKVIRPEKAIAAVRAAADLFLKELRTSSSVVFPSGVDTRAASISDQDLPKHEILIGETNRPETASVLTGLGFDEYAIAVVNEKLVITGGSTASTIAALEYFKKNFLSAPFKYVEGTLYKAKATNEEMILHVNGETSATVTELYPGVTQTHYTLSSDSVYGQQDFNLIQFDPAQSDLYFRVTCSDPDDITELDTIDNTIDKFNERNSEGLKAIAAINGDLWMVTYAHARVLGSSMLANGGYGGCTDAVVTSSFNLPRSFDVYEGEIVTSMHIPQETPYEGQFYSFGVTEDGKAVLGIPEVEVSVTDITSGKKISAYGINRLPVNGALIMYTDKVTSTRSLEDAYEVVIDCSDYTVRHGEVITGKVTAIYDANNAENPVMTENRIILTARGANRISVLSSFSVGDNISIEISVSDKMGNDADWQNIRNADGGHIPPVIDGVSQACADNNRNPATVLGIRSNGDVVFLINDGRQKGYSDGFMISQLDSLCAELDIVTAMYSDGGGSSTLFVLNKDGGYDLVNKPSDGSLRSVAGCVIVAFGPDKNK